jgi:hypothetical protein
LDRHYLAEKRMEGWMVSFIHAHVINLLHTVQGTRLYMTEKKPNRVGLKACVVRKTRSTGSIKGKMAKGSNDTDDTDDTEKEAGVRHDAILRLIRRGKNFDLLVMEVKAREKTWEEKKDIQKLEEALSANLILMSENFDDRRQLRTFGIFCSGFHFHLLEARFMVVKDVEVILMHQVYRGTIPTEVTEIHRLADLVEMFVMFKRRIETMIGKLHAGWATHSKLRRQEAKKRRRKEEHVEVDDEDL